LDKKVTRFTKADIDASARLLVAFLERNEAERLFKFPFSYSYPTNCCESVSLILTYLLEEKYGLENVAIIKGTKPRKQEHHFWVVAGDWNYDLTAHQFSCRKPIIGVLAHRFFFTFPEWAVEHGRDFVDRDEVVALYRQGAIPF
jgi:hypothetical protein